MKEEISVLILIILEYYIRAAQPIEQDPCVVKVLILIILEYYIRACYY